MRGKILAAWVLVLASIYAPFVFADTLDVPSQYSSISAALAEANQDDIIQVAPGTYYENNLVMPSGVTLMGTGFSSSETVIDGRSQGRILTLEFLETQSTIKNLSFTGGLANGETSYDQSGGAIFILCSPFLIERCRFIGNSAETYGGAVRCMGTPESSNIIRECVFDNNTAQGGGALDCSYDASPQVVNCSFKRNTAEWGGALACRGNSNPEVYFCRFDANETTGDLSHGGAVLSFFWGAPEFTLCTFSRNTADVGGAIYADTNSPTNLTSCTVTENTGLTEGSGLFTLDTSPEITSSIIAFQDGTGVLSLGSELPRITCSNIFGNTGGDWIGGISSQAGSDGNLSVDPLFCEANLDLDYMFNLQDDSPCTIEAGACANMGAWPVGCGTPQESLVSLTNFAVIWVNGVPTITWQVIVERGPVGFRLSRSSSDNPELEQDIPYTIGQNGEFIAQDQGFIPAENESYFYRLYLVVQNGDEILLGTVVLTSPPRILTLKNVGAWPNPFNPQTNVHFELSSSQKVHVEIYGIDGRRVRTLAQKTFPPGPQNLTWNGQDNNGRVLASGPYVVVITGEEETKRLKVTLLK